MARTHGAVAISAEQIEEVIERLSSGITLMQSCKKSKLDYANVVRRINRDDDLKHLHARSRDEYARARVDYAHDIAKDPKIEVARARLMIDMIKWEAARVLPKEFGDRVQQEVIITNNTTLHDRMSKARDRARRKDPVADAVQQVVTEQGAKILHQDQHDDA